LYYNVGRVHQTLRVTPAMEAGTGIASGLSGRSSVSQTGSRLLWSGFLWLSGFLFSSCWRDTPGSAATGGRVVRFQT